MQEWSEGYMTEVGYTYGYYAELNPLRARLALLASGHAPPVVHAACELGFGQGVGVNIHAAAQAATWHGTDFNPAQVAFARTLAGEGKVADRLADEAFADFCARTDLPDFDFIGMHGIWSWVSPANRAVLADFLRRKLKVGGVVYVSYNTQPGSAPVGPLRDLLAGHANALSPAGADLATRVDAALDFAQRLLDGGALFGRVNPIVAEQVRKLRGMDRHYLAHEYFNRDWAPVPFAQMADELRSAKLQFVCSAHYLDHVPAVHLTPQQQQLLADVHDPVFRETVRDFLVNQRFRRDYWVRGARRLAAPAQAELLRAQRIVLTTRLDRIEFEVVGVLGKARLHQEVYRPVLEQLADGKVRTLGEVERAVAVRGITLTQVLQALLVLGAKGAVHPAQEEADAERAAAPVRRLNAALCRMARHGGEVQWLASPVTGGGHPVGRTDQLLLLARSKGAGTPEAGARFVAEGLGWTGAARGPDGQAGAPAGGGAGAPRRPRTGVLSGRGASAGRTRGDGLSWRGAAGEPPLFNMSCRNIPTKHDIATSVYPNCIFPLV